MPQELNENIKKQYNLEKYKNPIFFKKTKDPLITVQVPSAGGGLTNTQIPESYLIDYLVKQGKEYDASKQYRVYDPKVVEKAKSENPERFADPLNNMLNNLMMGGASLTRAFTTEALQQSGKALTDLISKMSFSNTYTTGIGLAASPTTGAVVGDAALATATMIPVTYDISKNGLNLVNSAETALGLLPVIGPVTNNLSIGARNTKRAIDEFKLAREINKSAKNTKLINKDIEVVSPIGITEGAGLNAHSSSDVGFHFSPRWSSTSTAIQNQTKAPFVRVGYQTTSENIPYIVVNDKGNWTYNFNPEIYKGVNPGTTLSDNVLALDKIGPNFKYINLYEGKGSPSYFTTDTNSIQLSKNASAPRYYEPLETSSITMRENMFVTNLGRVGPLYSGFIGKDQIMLNPSKNIIFRYDGENWIKTQFENKSEYVNTLKKMHDDYVSTLSELDKKLYLKSNVVQRDQEIIAPYDIDKLVHKKSQEHIEDFYKSPEYKDRFMTKISNDIKVDPNQAYEGLLLDLDEVQKHYITKLFTHNIRRGLARTGELGLNVRVPKHSADITIPHEFGHLIYDRVTPSIDIIRRLNEKVIGYPIHNLRSDVFEINPGISREYIDYVSDFDELRQRIIPAVEEMFKNGWTVEETYNKSIALKEAQLKDIFNKDYILKLLGGMLSTTPLILNNK